MHQIRLEEVHHKDHICSSQGCKHDEIYAMAKNYIKETFYLALPPRRNINVPSSMSV
jgi:hypothetical protein